MPGRIPSPSVPVNGSVVRAVRQRLGLDYPTLAEKVTERLAMEGDWHVAATDIRQFEEGQAEVSLAEAEALAQSLLVPFTALFADSPPAAHLRDFRLGPEGRRAPLSYKTFVKLDEFEGFYRLAKAVSGPYRPSGLPQAPSTPHSKQSLENLAIKLRAFLGIPAEVAWKYNDDDAAYDAWKLAADTSGIFVFSLPMEVQEIRGASKWEREGPPAALVNTADSSAGRLFTLVHELVHLAIRQRHESLTLCDPSLGARTDDEWLANFTAAATLVPANTVHGILDGEENLEPNYRHWPAKLRRELRASFGVSHSVIGLRLKELNYVEDAGIRADFWRMKRPGGGGGGSILKWERYRKYLGDRAVLETRSAVDGDRLSTAEVGRILGLKSSDAARVIGLAPGDADG